MGASSLLGYRMRGLPSPAFSEPVPIWAAYTRENSDLPDDYVRALARSVDGALGVRAGGGPTLGELIFRETVEGGLETFNGLSPESEAQFASLISCKSVCCEISMETRVHPARQGH